MANEFLDALKGLGTAVQEFAVSQNFRNANERYQQIRKELQPGVEQRQAQIDLANDLFSRLSQAGMKPEAAAAVRTQYMPNTPSTAQAAFVQGQLNGDASMTAAGRELLEQENALKLNTLRQQFENQYALTERLEEGRDRRAGMRAEAEEARRASRPIPAAESKALFEIDEANAEMRGLLVELNKSYASGVVGPVDARYRNTSLGRAFGSPQENDLLRRLNQGAQSYKHKITGAASGIKEAEELKQDSGFKATDTLETLKTSIQSMLQKGEAARRAKLNIIEASGYNVSRFVNPAGFNPYQPQQGDSNTVSNLKKNIRND